MLKPFECYHVFNKSIADYTIFRDESDYLRMLGILSYYRSASVLLKYSMLDEMPDKNIVLDPQDELVRVFAYCLMPTHFHLVLTPVSPTGIPDYLRRSLIAYTRYFNGRYGRKGPLWQGRSKKVSVGVGEPFLYVTRYVHLNPVTAYLVDDPGKWEYSSYGRYIGKPHGSFDMAIYTDHVDMDTVSYQRFVVDFKDEQRKLAKLKKLFVE